MKDNPSLDLKTLAEAVSALGKSVGQFLKDELGKVASGAIETKSLNSLVSYVDKQAEIRLVKGLKTLLPEAGFLVEEGSAAHQNEAFIWIVDPLDGTTNFLHQIPVFSISIALQYKGEIVLGMVYEVMRDECFLAHQDGGAFLNGKTIRVSEEAKFSNALIATGFPYYDFERLNPYFEILKDFAQTTRGIRRIGSAAVDLAYLACGRFNAYFEYSLSPWDVAAGALIVKEAGGYVADFSKKQNWLHGKEIVAVAPPLKDDLFKILDRHAIKKAI